MSKLGPYDVIIPVQELLANGVELDPSVKSVAVTLILDVQGVQRVLLRLGTVEAIHPGHFLNNRSLLAKFDRNRGGKVL